MDTETDQPAASQNPAIDAEYGQKILDRIKASEKREDKWLKDAEGAEKVYAQADNDKDFGGGKTYDFNILHSNVETIVPAIYNSTPVPDIRPRRVEAIGPAPKPPQQQEGQPPDPQAVQQFQAAIADYQKRQQTDKAARDYASMIERAITVQIDDNALDCEAEQNAQDAFLAGRGNVRLRFEADFVDQPSGVDQAGQPVMQQVPANERIKFEAVSWRDFRMGPAKRWDEVPWVAFKVCIARETYDRMADNDLLQSQQKNGDAPATDSGKQNDDIEAWEYWDKIKGEVLFVRVDDGKVFKRFDDPLGLPGFFPCPKPLQPITLTGRMTPVCPFTIYRTLADELDRVTQRINRLLKVLKARGLVAGDASKLIELADAEDGEIRVVDNLESLTQTGGLDKAILWWPVEQIIKVITELYKARDQIKAAIYEITGISDIVRGASNAGETATAQQIKTQWGSLRIQKMQRLIERQVRDIFVMCAHIISTKFSPQSLTAMTGIEISPGMQAMMHEPIDRQYRINVESDSTVRADLTQKKKEMGEFLAGSAQFFQTAAGIIAQQPQAAEPLAEVYSASSRLFRLGKQAEDALDRFVSMAKETAQNPPPNPEIEKGKAELALRQKEVDGKLAMEGQKVQADAQRSQVDLQIKQLDLQIKQLELQVKQIDAHARSVDAQARVIEATTPQPAAPPQ